MPDRSRARPRRVTHAHAGYALASAALTASIVLAEQGQWYGAAAALVVATLLGEVGRRQRRRA